MLKKKDKSEKKPKAEAATPQGISSQGNALRNVVLLALLLCLVPLLAGFAYLTLVREPQAREVQLDRVSQSWASQQATSIHHLLTDLSRRVQGAAQSPMALQAIASGSTRTVDLVEKAMLDYGVLASGHHHAFEERWLAGRELHSELPSELPSELATADVRA